MYSLLIKFPFSNVNDESFELVIYTISQNDFYRTISILDADNRCFKFLSQQNVTIGGRTDLLTTYEGTLTGDVITADSDREDVFTPLVESKLKFNMACQTFPSWLMDLCNYYTNVGVMLLSIDGNQKTELWRGYLMANTLNMTVVDELMSCSLVAVDEIGMTKYLRFKENYNGPGSPTLFRLFELYWFFHVYQHLLNDLYYLESITPRRSLYFRTDMRIASNSLSWGKIDIAKVTINLERYMLERDVTWADVFNDICAYLNVAFCIGSVDNGGCDCYFLTDYNYTSSDCAVYTFIDGGSIQVSGIFNSFSNPPKVNADFQVSYKPCEWKGVKVTSEPKRPPVHQYLDKDNVKKLSSTSGMIQCRIGKSRDRQTLDDYKYRVFQYTQIVDKEDQWIPEENYIRMDDCHVAQESVAVAALGYFPLSAVNDHTRPQETDAHNMDFAMTKMGMITARLGSYETPRQSVSADLKDYFVILNHRWGRLYWDDDRNLEPSEYVNDIEIATFFPFANDTSIRPNNKSYLSIDLSAIILNENIGKGVSILENETQVSDLNGKIQAVFPMTDSFYDWAAGDQAEYTGNLVATNENYIVGLYFQPVLKCRLSIGNYYWDGSDWVYEANSSNAPTFMLRLTPSQTTKYYLANGNLHGDVENYYYNECHPRVGASDNIFRVPLYGLSTSSQPLGGVVRLDIFGPMQFVNARNKTVPGYSFLYYNNILFVLLSDIKIEFTDDAQLADRDIKTVYTEEIDPDSTTKKTKEVDLNLSTPTVDGVFNNCLMCQQNDKWVNLQKVRRYNGADIATFEQIKAEVMASVLCDKQVFVEFSKEFSAVDWENIYNVCFTVAKLVEADGTFAPLTRQFNWTKGYVRWKMQKVL